MNTFVVFAGLLALAAGVPLPEEVVAAEPAAVPTLNLAPILVRAPAHDSASIESHRLGGNFAYAVAEAHAYAQVTPQVSTLTHPVAETTVVHEPATIAKVVPGAVTTTKHIPHPIIETQPILAQEPLIQAKTTFTTPHHKVSTYTHELAQPITHHQTHHVAPVVAPVTAHVAAPAAYAVAAPVEAVPAAVPAGYGYAGHGYHHFAPHNAHFGYAGFPHGFHGFPQAPVAVAAEAPVAVAAEE
jgi:hypothetical protein